MGWKCDRRAVEMEIMVVRSGMVRRHMIGMHGHVLFMRIVHRRSADRSRCKRLHGSQLGLRGRARIELVRDRRPSMSKTGRVHAGDHGHDVHRRFRRHEGIVVRIDEVHLNGLLLGRWRKVFSLVQNVIVTPTTASVVERRNEGGGKKTYGR